MAPRPEPAENSNLTLQIGPGHPGQSEFDVRVSPGHANELRECFEAEGLHVSNVIELSAGGWLEVLAVSLGTGGAVSVAITKFFERHKGKKITFGAEGKVETMEGYSAKDVQQVLDDVAQRQRETDQTWADMLKRLPPRPDTDDKPSTT
ncbi:MULTISPECIES: hypothetical protein [Pseudonocardiaceae]|uniref:Uncharacterized protein n=1 Tax=Prauserella endophytica TaxID=1592324 RepID=A0ABY2RTQ9_9PSEU|nr:MULTISPECIES: hypothetical protein [Pseudonocardiaceae]TKG60255.1 hypothetical protein FCN18_35825 [Prauserella endophytica]